MDNSVINENPGIMVETPCCMLHTKAGCIPFLTQETFEYLDKKIVPRVYQVPFPSVIGFKESFKAFPGPASELFALTPGSHIYFTIQDASRPPPKGYNSKTAIAVWNSAGKTSVTADEYMKYVESMQPSLYQPLADGDVLKSDSRKRIMKSVDRTLQHLEDCLQFHAKSEALRNAKVVCVIEGGNLLEERKRCAKLTISKLHELSIDPWGFVIDSIPVDTTLTAAAKDFLKTVISVLPSDKPVAVHGHGHPLAVIDLLECGVSIFDSTYVTMMCEKKLGLIYKTPNENFCNSSLNVKHDNQCDKEIELKIEKFKETVDLSNPQFANKFTPILDGCSCYTCLHHTQAYIHHLLNVGEMLAPVLLMLHNLHHHLNFFCFLRRNVKQASLPWLKKEMYRINAD